MTQQSFLEIYSKYLEHFNQYEIAAFNIDVHPISTWVRKLFNIDKCDWKVIPETVKDIYGQELQVRQIAGKKFAIFSFADTKLWKCCLDGIVGLSSYDSNKPIRHINNSFYNSGGSLIYWDNDEQLLSLKTMFDKYMIIQKEAEM